MRPTISLIASSVREEQIRLSINWSVYFHLVYSGFETTVSSLSKTVDGGSVAEPLT